MDISRTAVRINGAGKRSCRIHVSCCDAKEGSVKYISVWTRGSSYGPFILWSLAAVSVTETCNKSLSTQNSKYGLDRNLMAFTKATQLFVVMLG